MQSNRSLRDKGVGEGHPCRRVSWSSSICAICLLSSLSLHSWALHLYVTLRPPSPGGPGRLCPGRSPTLEQG